MTQSFANKSGAYHYRYYVILKIIVSKLLLVVGDHLAAERFVSSHKSELQKNRILTCSYDPNADTSLQKIGESLAKLGEKERHQISIVGVQAPREKANQRDWTLKQIFELLGNPELKSLIDTWGLPQISIGAIAISSEMIGSKLLANTASEHQAIAINTPDLAKRLEQCGTLVAMPKAKAGNLTAPFIYDIKYGTSSLLDFLNSAFKVLAPTVTTQAESPIPVAANMAPAVQTAINDDDKAVLSLSFGVRDFVQATANGQGKMSLNKLLTDHSNKRACSLVDRATEIVSTLGGEDARNSLGVAPVVLLANTFAPFDGFDIHFNFQNNEVISGFITTTASALTQAQRKIDSINKEVTRLKGDRKPDQIDTSTKGLIQGVEKEKSKALIFKAFLARQLAQLQPAPNPDDQIIVDIFAKPDKVESLAPLVKKLQNNPNHTGNLFALRFNAQDENDFEKILFSDMEKVSTGRISLYQFRRSSKLKLANEAISVKTVAETIPAAVDQAPSKETLTVHDALFKTEGAQLRLHLSKLLNPDKTNMFRFGGMFTTALQYLRAINPNIKLPDSTVLGPELASFAGCNITIIKRGPQTVGGILHIKVKDLLDPNNQAILQSTPSTTIRELIAGKTEDLIKADPDTTLVLDMFAGKQDANELMQAVNALRKEGNRKIFFLGSGHFQRGLDGLTKVDLGQGYNLFSR